MLRPPWRAWCSSICSALTRLAVRCRCCGREKQRVAVRREQDAPRTMMSKVMPVHRSPRASIRSTDPPCAMVGMDHPTFRNGGGGAPHLRPLVSRICICVSPEPRSMTHPVRVRVRPGACAQKAVKREPTLLLRKTSQKLLLCSPSFAGPACTAAAECGLLLL